MQQPWARASSGHTLAAGDAAGGVDDGGAGGLAAQFIVVEGRAQQKQGADFGAEVTLEQPPVYPGLHAALTCHG